MRIITKMARLKLKDVTKNNKVKAKTDRLKQLFKSFILIVDNSPQNPLVYCVAIVLKYIDLSHFIFKPRFTKGMNFQIFEYFTALINSCSLETYIGPNYDTLRYILFYLIFCLLTFNIVSMVIIQKLGLSNESILNKICAKFIAYFDSIVLKAFSASIYTLLLAAIIYNKAYMFGENKSSSLVYFNMGMAVIALLMMLIINAINILLLTNDNPFVLFKAKGSSKLILFLSEVERLAYAIYFLVDTGNTLVNQFVLVILVLNVLKIYLRIYMPPYTNDRINFVENVSEAFYIFVVMSLNYYIFFVTEGQDEIFFYSLIVGVLVFQYMYTQILNYAHFRGLSHSTQELMSEKDAVNKLHLLGILLDNYKSNRKNARMFSYIIEHNSKCKEADCKCHTILNFSDKSRNVRKALAIFIEDKATKFHKLHPRNIEILIYLISVCVYERNKIFKGITYYNIAKVNKTNFISNYHLFTLR